jgi:predicted HicB family RNase H-like nuclease
MKKTLPAPLTIRIDPQLKADLQALARSDDRSLANFVERLLRREVEKKKPAK